MAKSKKSPKVRKIAPKRPESGPRQQVPAKGASSSGGGLFSPDSIRETIESVVIAFILAFLFRTFEAEAFVIPTGSMAPTLMGRHKDVECPECGFFYRVTASQEVDSETNRLTGVWTVGGTCPMCRFPAKIGDENPQGKRYKSYSGDRILVEKFPFQFRDPERFEVCVFKFPGGPKTNYIKRICGLPNETLCIRHGDLFVRPIGAPKEEETIARKKDPKKLLAILQPVYDTNYISPTLIAAGFPQRWINGDGALLTAPDAWNSEDHKSFRIDGQGTEDVWLRYQHVVPNETDWMYLKEGTAPSSFPKSQLISDFTAYNTKTTSRHQVGCPLSGLGVHWVGDLVLECDTTITSPSGQILLELVEGGRRFLCTLDVATGVASLSIDGQSSLGTPKAETGLHGGGRHHLRFANVDDQLQLWVDQKEIAFDAPTTYAPLGNVVPTQADLQPAGIASRGAAMEVHRIRLLRDLYYIADDSSARGYPLSDYQLRNAYGGPPDEKDVREFLSDPDLWFEFANFQEVEFPLEEDEFLALGDNSGESKDSRLWRSEDGVGPQVPRDLLIGKALFIYWPHSEDRIPGTSIPFPFFPNFKRMWVIR